MNFEHLLRSLKAQPQERAPSNPASNAVPASSTSASSMSAPAVAPAAAPAAPAESPPAARIQPIVADDLLMSRWPIFRSHATPAESSVPLSDEEKKNRLEPAELPPSAKSSAGDFIPQFDSDIAKALKRLNADLLASPALPTAAVASVDAVEPAAPDDIDAGSVEIAVAVVPVAAVAVAPVAVAPVAIATASDGPSLVSLFDRLRGQAASTVVRTTRRRSLASSRMTRR